MPSGNGKKAYLCHIDNSYQKHKTMAILNLNYNALWESVCSWSRKAGRAATRPALLMWYVLRSDKTPRADKLAIFTSLAYLVLPIDLLDAKRLPIIGWLDEVMSLALLVQKMSKYITPEMEARADKQLDEWFPEYVGYEAVEE